MAVGKKTNKAGLGRKWFRLRSFAACVRKDICLFSSAAGIACLLLPFIAACLLAFGLNDALAAENVIEPFPVAVIDRDETVMSRMLIGQLRRIELFSEIRCVSGSEFDSAFRTAEDAAPTVDFEEDMLAGCAAAVTIPKDYFYSVYYMDEGKVDAWLNGEMPLESELTADIIESVAEIMAGERAAMLAAFRIAEGDEPSAEAVQRFRDACANAVLDSALGRRAVFKDSPGALGVRSVEVIREKYFVCAVCMLFFSVSLASTVKTKDICLSAFSFAYAGAKEKATKKKTPKEDFALCGALTQSRRRRHTRSAYVSIPTAVGGRRRLLKKAGENFNDGA